MISLLKLARLNTAHLLLLHAMILGSRFSLLLTSHIAFSCIRSVIHDIKLYYQVTLSNYQAKVLNLPTSNLRIFIAKGIVAVAHATHAYAKIM